MNIVNGLYERITDLENILGRLKGGELMGLLEKKQEVLRQIEKLADTQGWNATASEISLDSEYFSDISVLFTRCMEDIEYPNLEIVVDCADEPYIEILSINIPYSKGYIGFTYEERVGLEIIYEERVGLEIIPKLLEQMELVSGLPEKLSEYLSKVIYL